MLEVQKDCPSKPVNASSFMVTFDEGSRGYVGWASASATKGYREHFEWVRMMTNEMKDGDGGNNSDDSDEDDEDYCSDDSNDDTDDDGDDDSGNSDDDSSGDEESKDNEENRFCFDLWDGAFKVADIKRKKKTTWQWSRKLPVTILCSRNAALNQYTIEVLEKGSTTCNTATDARIMDTYCIEEKDILFPFITFSGQVTISKVLYAY
jgi:hypothetical protein